MLYDHTTTSLRTIRLQLTVFSEVETYFENLIREITIETKFSKCQYVNCSLSAWKLNDGSKAKPTETQV